jgi:hypothetical protein
MESEDSTLEMKCSLEKDGTVTCNITQDDFNDIQQENIKPKKIVFEIDDEPEE